MDIITKESILKAKWANKIRELNRAICEFPGKPREIELRTKKEMELNGEFREESKKANSADRIGQLTALRFKTQMESKILSRGKIGELSENGIPGIREEIQIENI